MLAFEAIEPADTLRRLLALLVSVVANLFNREKPIQPHNVLDADVLYCELFEPDQKKPQTADDMKARVQQAVAMAKAYGRQ